MEPLRKPSRTWIANCRSPSGIVLAGTNTEDAYYNGGTGSVLNNGGDSVALWTDEDKLQDVFAN